MLVVWQPDMWESIAELLKLGPNRHVTAGKIYRSNLQLRVQVKRQPAKTADGAGGGGALAAELRPIVTVSLKLTERLEYVHHKSFAQQRQLMMPVSELHCSMAWIRRK
jgi:hypothetical protein